MDADASNSNNPTNPNPNHSCSSTDSGDNPLDLRNLLNIDRADRIFQELLRQVATQSAEIRELRELVARCATNEMLHRVGCTLQGHVKTLDARAHALEESTGGKGGRAVAQRLDEIDASLEGLTKRTETHASERALQEL